MRELKFRAWDDVMKTMIYPSENHEPCDMALELCGRPISHYREGYQDYRCQLMQCTGLRDKNGKEIWEGDLVKYGDYEKPLEVMFCEHCASFRLQLPGFGNNEPIDREIEVIGNTSENPELLGEKND